MYEGLHPSGGASACRILGSGSSSCSTDIGMCTNGEVSPCEPCTWQEGPIPGRSPPLKKQVLACPSILIEEPRGSLPFWLHFTIETALNRAESASIVLVREAWISFPNRVSFATWLSVAYLLQDGSIASRSFEHLAWEINLDALPIRHKAL